MGMYTDIDGTISKIALTPSAAAVEPRAIAALDRIRASGVRVVAISGRAATDAHALVGLDDIDYAGNHGFELADGQRPPGAGRGRDGHIGGGPALDEARAALPALPSGVLVEDKTYTGSVHFRLAEDQSVAEALLRVLLTDISARNGLALTEGRLVFELRPRLHINKGVFTAKDIRLHKLSRAAFLGDDITDLDGFAAIKELLRSR